MRGVTILGIILWAIIPGVIAEKKGRSGIGYFFLSLIITPLVTTIIVLCLTDLNKGKDRQPENAFSLDSIYSSENGSPSTETNENKKGFGAFESKEEADYVHNAISKGSTFDGAIAEFRKQHQNNNELDENGTSALSSTMPPVSFCRKCGNKLPEGSTFCNKCGTKIIAL